MLKNGTVTHDDIVREVHRQTHYPMNFIDEMVRIYFSDIEEHLKHGDRVKIYKYFHVQRTKGIKGQPLMHIERLKHLLNLAKKTN